MSCAIHTRRGPVRAMKRAVAQLGNAEAMIGLLTRSVVMGHKRLALIRCLQAEKMGIVVSSELFAYCRTVAASMTASELESLASRVDASAVEQSERAQHGR